MKIAIWGTGVYGKDLLSYLKDYEIHCESEISVAKNIVCFYDNVASDKLVEAIPILRPVAESIRHIDIIIVAVKKYEDIIRQINKMKDSPYVLTYNPRHRLRLMYELRELLPSKQYRDYFYYIAERLDSIAKVIGQRKERNMTAWHAIIEDMGDVNFIATVEEAGDVALNEYLYEHIFSNYYPSIKIKTIGIYYYRFYNGGIERVISQLMPIFLQLGFKVVLITNEIDKEAEYTCPKEVVRAVLRKKDTDSFEWYRSISELVEQYKIDLMHLHGCYDYYETTMIVPFFKMSGVCTVLHIHNFYQNIKDMDRLLLAYRLADRVVVLSREDEAFWNRQGVKAKYIPNPVNLDIDYMYHSKKSKRPTIVWVGRVEEEQKQVYETVRIMKELVKAIPVALLKIIGKADNPQVLEKLQSMIGEEGLEANFKLCGFSQNPWQECGDADVFLMTSAYEGFPMVLMESKMAGLPAVIYSLPYLELLKDRKGYFEVEPRDAIGAARKLKKILMDKNIQENLSKESRNSIEVFSKFDLLTEWKELFENINSE